jgi:putative ABC transport system ATP-binding protein
MTAGMTAASRAGHAGLAVSCQNVVHIYTTLAGHDVVALRGVNLDIAAGEQVALLGPSGSGKSTLLGLFGGLQRASAGRVVVDGVDISRIGESELTRLRAGQVASLLQGARRNLLTYATAAGNVDFARRGLSAADVRRLPTSRQLLEQLGLGELTDQPVTAMSGGEQQRVALAVTVSSGADLLLADEPTSQLGHADRDTMVDLIGRVNAELGTTVVIVTHDPDIAARIPRRITIRNGRIGSEGVHGRDYSVIDQDGAVHLPQEWAEDYPPGSLVEFEETQDGFFVRRVDVGRPDGRPDGRGGDR